MRIDAAWWSLIGSQKEGEQRGWVNTDALACRHIKTAKSLKTSGGVCMRVCMDKHVLVLMRTYLHSCQPASLKAFFICEGNYKWENMKGGVEDADVPLTLVVTSPTVWVRIYQCVFVVRVSGAWSTAQQHNFRTCALYLRHVNKMK